MKVKKANKTIEDPIKNLERIAKKIKINKKIDPHMIEDEYEERWEKAQSIYNK